MLNDEETKQQYVVEGTRGTVLYPVLYFNSTSQGGLFGQPQAGHTIPVLTAIFPHIRYHVI